ncbi:hypothetical protein K1719_043251 [Acacia pycnantha]|nr:hypothetical protein K1719_043251 [Acacia pycnantha]
MLSQLEMGSEYTPRLIKDLTGVKVKYVAAGLQTSACTDENGSVFIFGEKGIDKCKKYPSMELWGLFQYLVNQLKKDQGIELCVLQVSYQDNI